MENLDDRYDPDRWIASGKDLKDFRGGGPEAERYYATHPELGRRVTRWTAIMAERTHKAWRELNEPGPNEEELREIWRSLATKPP